MIWYTTQTFISGAFNGINKVGVLFPLLLNVNIYMDELSVKLTNINMGC